MPLGNTLTFYLNLNTGSIEVASYLTYYLRFKSGVWAYIGKLQCNQNGFYSKEIANRVYGIYRTLYGKEVFIKTISDKDLIQK